VTGGDGAEAEVPLRGGNLSVVVRVGDTVRRPTGPWTPAVHALLRHLEGAGFEGAPRVLGIDERGREVLEYVEGEVAWADAHHRLLGTDDDMVRAGALLRRFHEAVARFTPPHGATWRFPDMQADAERWSGGEGTIVCHNDPGAWNLVVGDRRWALIDWDAAGPRPPVWDLAYAARGLVPVSGGDPARLGWPGEIPDGRRLRALVDGYGLDAAGRGRFADVVVARLDSSYEHMRRRATAGEQPWVDLWRGGHGAGWAADLAHARRRLHDWHRTLSR
jgi:aminoglycoside phosphotransferase (APT) family kinase protein